MNTTSKTPRTDLLISTLTVELAREYEQQADKLIWIETQILDPLDLNRCHAVRVEEALLSLLAQA